MRKKKIYCPVNGWDCPYYKNNECGMENPYKDCDDFYGSYGDDYKLSDFYTDEKRTVFE